MKELIALVQPAFDWTWKNSVQVALLIGLVLLVQKVLGRWLTPRLRYALSLLILFRLLLPAVPPSPLSIENLFTPSAGIAVREAVSSGVAEPAGPITSIAAEPVPVASTPARPAAAPFALAASSRPPTLSVVEVLGLVWACGLLALVSLAGWRYAQWCRLIRQGQRLTDTRLLALLDGAREAMGVRRPVTLVALAQLSSPAVFGFWRVRLLLPEDALAQLTDRDLRLLFLHEMAHVRRQDMLLNLLLMAVQFVHWFNPLVWVGLHRLRTDRELVCDAMVLQRTRPEERLGYGSLLLKLLTDFPTAQQVIPTAVPVVSSKSEIKRRIILIKHHRSASLAACVATALSALALACLTFTGSSQPLPSVQPLPLPAINSQPAENPLVRHRISTDLAQLKTRAQADDYVEITAELDSTWKFQSQTNYHHKKFKCVVGSNDWYISGDFAENASSDCWLVGSNVIELTTITKLVDIPRLRGMPNFQRTDYGIGSQTVVVYPTELPPSGPIMWLAFCSANYLQQDDRQIPLPLLPEFRSVQYSVRRVLFETEPRLPKSVRFYDAKGELLCQYEALQTTNFSGRTFPLAFRLLEGATELLGKITAIQIGKIPQIPERVEKVKEHWDTQTNKASALVEHIGKLTANQIRARGLEGEFIRKPGQYHLDDGRSILTITGLTSNSWSLKVTWRSEKRTATGGLEKTEASDAPAGCLRAEGWFVFVETPERIWIYDGLDSGTLLMHSEKEIGSAAFSPELMASCPQKVWNAFPKGFQENNRKYRKVEL